MDCCCCCSNTWWDKACTGPCIVFESLCSMHCVTSVASPQELRWEWKHQECAQRRFWVWRVLLPFSPAHPLWSPHIQAVGRRSAICNWRPWPRCLSSRQLPHKCCAEDRRRRSALNSLTAPMLMALLPTPTSANDRSPCPPSLTSDLYTRQPWICSHSQYIILQYLPGVWQTRCKQSGFVAVEGVLGAGMVPWLWFCRTGSAMAGF